MCLHTHSCSLVKRGAATRFSNSRTWLWMNCRRVPAVDTCGEFSGVGSLGYICRRMCYVCSKCWNMHMVEPLLCSEHSEERELPEPHLPTSMCNWLVGADLLLALRALYWDALSSWDFCTLALSKQRTFHFFLESVYLCKYFIGTAKGVFLWNNVPESGKLRHSLFSMMKLHRFSMGRYTAP